MKAEASRDFHVFMIWYKTRTQMRYAKICYLFSEAKQPENIIEQKISGTNAAKTLWFLMISS